MSSVLKVLLLSSQELLPNYEPDLWNDNGTIQDNNNCYNYACNIQTNTYAQPGEASGNMYTSFTCDDISNGAISDGLKRIESQKKCGLCCHKVALAMDSDNNPDYHWYRQDRDGLWSHKPGMGSVRNYDNAGSLIHDPSSANRGRYNIFCGYFCVCKGCIKIK